jgi:hypothetical protein
MLALAHSTANYSVNRRFNEAGGNSPSYTLPRAIVDQRFNVALEIRDHIREAVACFLDLAANRGFVRMGEYCEVGAGCVKTQHHKASADNAI